MIHIFIAVVSIVLMSCVDTKIRESAESTRDRPKMAIAYQQQKPKVKSISLMQSGIPVENLATKK